MWGFLVLWLPGQGYFSAPLFPVLTLMHSGRGQMNIIYKVSPLWPTPFTNQQTRAETTGSYGDLFDEFWKEKGKKKMWPSNNPLRNPSWSYIFLKLSSLQRGRNSTRLCSLEIVEIKEDSKRTSWVYLFSATNWAPSAYPFLVRQRKEAQSGTGIALSECKNFRAG